MAAQPAPQAIDTYFSKIKQTFEADNSSEPSYCRALKDFIEDVVPGLRAISDDRRLECGVPRVAVLKPTGDGHLRVGYIETKDLATSLDKVERTEQLRKYLALPNLILTNYRELRWYVRGERKATARFATLDKSGKLKGEPKAFDDATRLLRAFLDAAPERIADAGQLAQRMAGLTSLLRDSLRARFEREPAQNEIVGELFAAIGDMLRPTLTLSDFADIFAQTTAYGLFAARLNHTSPRPFRRELAAFDIPATNPFLCTLFAYVVGPDIGNESFVAFVDELSQLLAYANVDTISRSFSGEENSNDPIIQFYETFLALYDPQLRRSRGVYYTPTAVVDFIVEAVDSLLRSSFECSAGLAALDHSVRILDPACGTGTFLYSVIKHIRQQFIAQDKAAEWRSYVRDTLLPRLVGFEVLAAPYAVAHLKIAIQLSGVDLPAAARPRWDYNFDPSDKLGIFLTNSLERPAEANAAAHIKPGRPIMVVLGNPPYSIRSGNLSKSATAFVEPFRYADRTKLKERGALKYETIIQDDYIKFWGFALNRILKTGQGVIAYISNNGFLSNRVLRGMRYALHTAFDRIYVIDLHGNSNKGEVSPDGSADDNVFDINQGVAITICVKLAVPSETHVVHFAEAFGSRNAKYSWLNSQTLQTIAWHSHAPTAPYYRFRPGDVDLEREYDDFIPVDELMPFNKAGIITGRDDFATSFDEAPLLDRLSRFLDKSLSDAEVRAAFSIKDGGGYKMEYRRHKALQQNVAANSVIVDLLYRPFDVRKCAYTDAIITSPQHAVSNQMIGRTNVGLILARGSEIQRGWEHVFCTRLPIQHHTVSIKEVNYLFPLWRHPPNLLDPDGQLSVSEKTANLKPDTIAKFAERLGAEFHETAQEDAPNTFCSEDVLAYVYAILNCNVYRSRYAELLTQDFPRLPLPATLDSFRGLVEAGQALLATHLGENAERNTSVTYPEPGSNVVEPCFPVFVPAGATSKYNASPGPAGRVYINAGSSAGGPQYFDGVTLEAWEYRIGGYKPAERWLRDRRGRTLAPADLSSYEALIDAAMATPRLVSAIDEAYQAAFGDVEADVNSPQRCEVFHSAVQRARAFSKRQQVIRSSPQRTISS